MPALGGQSTAHGIRYEAWAVVYELTDVLCGNSDWVRPQAVALGSAPGEPPASPVVDDYVVYRRGRREYHSAKYRAPGRGQWTVRKLIAEGVLDEFSEQHREDPEAALVLTTESDSAFVEVLCKRAAITESLEKLTQWPLTTDLQKDWNKALAHLQWSEEELFGLCRTISLHKLTVDETGRNAERWLAEHFAGGGALPSLLFDLALEAAAEGRRLDREAILAWLQERGIYPNTPLSTGDLLSDVLEAGAALRQYPHEIAGVHLDRPEVNDLVEWALAEDHDQELAMLLDIFGGGKSVILRDVLVALEQAGTPTLAIKADLLSGVDRPGDLAEKLALPASVEQVMGQLAAHGPAVAIVDQLDALSLTLSRDQAALDLMLDTIARLRGIAGVRVMASCRTFDLNTDPKLSQIRIDRKVSPKPLTQEQIACVLQAAGIEAASLLPSLLELLCIPQNLKVFVEVVEARRANLNESNEQLVAAVGGFKSLQDLYGELWRQKVEFTPSGAPPAEERRAAIDLLVGYMHQHRRVSAPEPLLDSHIDAARYLEREDILRRDGSLWFFSHQTLYDYCYARRFIRQGSSLHDEILAGDQGLFVRSEMVQILTYLRGVDMAAYLEQLERLLYAKPLRYHLRFLLLQWFGAIPDPTPDELVIAGRLLRDDDRRWGLMRGVMGNGAWFDLLDEELLDELLRHDDEQVTQQVVAYLESMVNVRTRRVLDRLKPRLGETESWDRYISRCLAELDTWSNPDAVDMLINLVTRGQIDKWLREECMRKLARSDPAAACRALRVYLDRRLSDWLANSPGDTDVSTQNPTDILATRNEEYVLWDTVDHLSKTCPTEWLFEILPWVRQVAEGLARYSRAEVYYFDPLFSWGWHGQGQSAGSELMRACRTALGSVAVDRPEQFRTIAVDLSQSQLYSMHRLLAQAYIAHPEGYAEDIFTYLSADSRRLHLGDMDAPYYDSHQLIGAAFPRLTGEQCLALESIILTYESQWERTTLGAWGYGQFQLLQAIPPELLTDEARLRLLQLERKFPSHGIEVPHGITGGIVGPPIHQEAQAHMSDEAWLGAMGKYDDSTEWASPSKEFLKGGVIELSGALKEHAKAEPDRFYKLALRFDESISSRYAGAVVGGLAESEAPAEYVFDLARRFSTRTDSQLRMEICRAMSRRAQDGVPDDLLGTLSDYATGDRDPEQELWSQASPSGDLWYRGDPHHHGMNTVRGAAIGDLCRCALMRKPPDVQLAFRTLDQVVNDPSTAVRACAIDSLVYLLQYDGLRAVDLFERALDGHKALLRCQPAQRFLYYACQSHFPRLRGFVEAMMTHDDETTRQAGARLACLAAFTDPDAEDLADKAACGDAVLRLGAAQVYARNLTNPRLEDRCLARLTIMMRDTDGRVREEVGECFRNLRAEHLFRIRGFIRDFVSSPALAQGAFHLARYLRAYAAQDCALALEAVEAIVNQLGDELMDITRGMAHVHLELVPMILTVYGHSRDPEQRGRAMDLFEQLLARGSYAARTALSDYDRR